MKKSKPDQHKDFELIGRFIHFELSEPELQDFEERLESDPVLQERFRLYREMDQEIDKRLSAAEPHDFRQLLRAGADEPTSLKVGSRQPWLRIAAAVALLMAAGLWWFLWPAVLDSPTALADYYWDRTDKTHLLEANRRGEGPADPNAPARTFFRTIRDYHDSQQFGTMIDQLEVYLATTPDPVPFEDDAEWLLAIAYVANSKLANARRQLEQIIERYPARQARAQQMLNDLEELEATGQVRK